MFAFMSFVVGGAAAVAVFPDEQHKIVSFELHQALASCMCATLCCLTFDAAFISLSALFHFVLFTCVSENRRMHST